MNISFRGPVLATLLVLPTLFSAQLAVAAPAEHSSYSTSAKSLVANQSEVRKVYGSAFRIFMHFPYGKETIAKSALKGCANSRYTSGYGVTYGNFSRATSGSAVVSVVSAAFIYPSSNAAGCAFKSLPVVQGRLKALGGKVLSLSGLGDKAYAVMSSQKNAKGYGITLIFQRGRYTGTLTVGAKGRQPKLSDILRLGKLMDTRMQLS